MAWTARRITSLAAAFACALPLTTNARAQDDAPSEKEEAGLTAASFSGISARGIGPALMSGRISDLAINAKRPGEYYVAVACGGVWKTTNWGTTFKPVFDGQGSYSIGCVTIDPHNPSTVWVGTGENNSQRSVGYGDGVYKSVDGGASWTNMGLKDSGHIGMVRVHPDDPNTVYVAALGPLWSPGGDRGLYRTTDGGATWEKILEISENTGINEVHLDPRDPDVMYATAYQRRRHVWTLVNGGPEGGIHKSTDGGATWREVTSGLPSADIGRIGMAVSPADPDVLYAIVEAADGKGGMFRSTNRGESWEKRSDYMSSSPQYYNELFCDPYEVGTLYSMDTFSQVSRDGGKTWAAIPEEHKHVDSHAMWIDPHHTDHWLIGCDGGLYETWDRGTNWHFKKNLPVTQFYKIALDDAVPFYNVYGGTQDNNTQGGPTRTTDRIGIANEHWFITVGGDGFEAAVEPGNPDIVYSQWQHGYLVRFDRRSGEILDIKPREGASDPPFVWNWDSPLIISHHSPARLYFASDRLHRSDDRGGSWKTISGDLTRNINRNELEVMGVIQKPDAVAKHNSTSIYGNCVALDESPVQENLVYVGTDDGLIHVTADAGGSWNRIDTFPGVPDRSYVSCLRASHHDADTIFAAFDNHKMGDYKPYLLRSDDRGATWTSIAGDLPERGSVYAIAQDHLDPNLLFCGTEFAAYFSRDGGAHWFKVSGIPPIAVRDIEIQRREHDVVFGTFGRGFYVLDDYTPLRAADESTLKSDAVLFGVRDALSYVPRARLEGKDGLGSQGDSFYAAPNPPFGAVFTYHLAEKLESRKERRQTLESSDKDAEEEEREGEAPGLTYPTIDEFRAEDREREPRILLTVTDEAGAVVARITGPRDKGFHRVAWNLRYPPSTPIEIAPQAYSPWENAPAGPLAAPGTYTVTLAKEIDGALTPLAEPRSFRVLPLDQATFAAEDKQALLAFQRSAARLQRTASGSTRYIRELQNRLDYLRAAVLHTPELEDATIARVDAVSRRLRDLRDRLSGDPTLSRRAEPEAPSIMERIGVVVDGLLYVTSAPTGTQREQLDIARTQFQQVLDELRGIVDTELPALEEAFDAAGAPWTPGRFPVLPSE